MAGKDIAVKKYVVGSVRRSASNCKHLSIRQSYPAQQLSEQHILLKADVSKRARVDDKKVIGELDSTACRCCSPYTNRLGGRRGRGMSAGSSVRRLRSTHFQQ